MSEKNNDLTSKFRHQRGIKDTQNKYRSDTARFENQSAFFGVERGNRFIKRFTLMFRDGRMVSVPYAYLPIIQYDPDRNVIIKTSELEITMTGRGLNVLADWLSEERIIWMKESDSGIDTGDDAVFIKAIKIEGEIMT